MCGCGGWLTAGISSGFASAADVSLEVGAPPEPAASPASAGDSPYGRLLVDLRYRPASLRPAALSLKPGQVLTSQNLSMALNELAGHLRRHSERIAAASGGSTLLFTYVDAEFDLNPRRDGKDDTVAVTLRPLHLSLPLDDIGGRVLPIPRGLSAHAAGITARRSLVPGTLALSHDRAVGTSVRAGWQFDLDPRGDDGNEERQLRLRAGGLKSIDASFYSGYVESGATWKQTAGWLRQMFADVEGAVSLEPRGLAHYRSRSVGISAGITLSWAASNRLLVDSRMRRAEQDYRGTGAAERSMTSNEQGNRMVFETIPPGMLGFFRTAVWQDNLNPRNAPAAQRLVLRAGYSKEVPVGVNRSIGLEMVGGAGQAWGNVPDAQRFFSGGGQGEFLYEGARSRTLITAPDGPLLRSLGRAQGGLRQSGGGVRGGTHFWHLNLNLTLPIPQWSRPLIPNEATDLPGPDGSPQTLKQILQAQVDRTGPNMLQSTLQARDGLTPEAAKRRATEIFRGIRPAAHFVINQANVFAVKPLIMFDLAELNFSPGRASWAAAGFGVQLTLVTAKFEAGYMRTLSGPTFGSRGNVFARLGFERLF